MLWLTGAFLFALLIPTKGVRADRYDTLRADQTIENGLLIVAVGDTVRGRTSQKETGETSTWPYFRAKPDQYGASRYGTWMLSWGHHFRHFRVSVSGS
jgi:hypothetical protein